ncbi:hypothetical protein AALA56_04490 [Streptococcus hyointestinalis]|uniref:DUF7204 family protein n=1 Tax=Streptococcus hyointestinalis TaxID=1337 RepID=UPI0035122924
MAKKQAWTVDVYFDNMLDESHYYSDEGEALKAKADLERKYQGKRLYRVEMEEVRDEESSS